MICIRKKVFVLQEMFKTDIIHKDIYGKSPYLRGVLLWNTIPYECQDLLDSRAFNNNIKKFFNIY